MIKILQLLSHPSNSRAAQKGGGAGQAAVSSPAGRLRKVVIHPRSGLVSEILGKQWCYNYYKLYSILIYTSILI